MDEDKHIMAGYYEQSECCLEAFKTLVDCKTEKSQVPFASQIVENIPIYEIPELKHVIESFDDRKQFMTEIARVLGQGAGVVVLKRAYQETGIIDEATEIYNRIIAEEKIESGEGADHFAAAGNNDRIWNSLQKLCITAPEVFIRYFANLAIDAVCQAWLGPAYQMTAQINLVRPGGKAQQPHRDYHLGFQTAEICATYPSHVHDLSPLMTLQGGIAHVDMPVESGPTKLLPFSQLYRPGYAAWRRDDFRQLFEERYVQLPLEKGDAIFFNPALFHGAGDNNSSNNQRMVNLLQVSSAFGRAMESVDRKAMCEAVYLPLMKCWQEGKLNELELDALLASTAEGYSFPTNLDLDPPSGGLAPQSQQALLKQAIVCGEKEGVLFNQLNDQQRRQCA